MNEMTKNDISYATQYNDAIIIDNAVYYVTFRGTQMFNICYVWIMNNKDKILQELFDMIKYFDKLHYQ